MEKLTQNTKLHFNFCSTLQHSHLFLEIFFSGLVLFQLTLIFFESKLFNAFECFKSKRQGMSKSQARVGIG